MRSALTAFMAMFVTTTSVALGQLVPPMEGYQLGGQQLVNVNGQQYVNLSYDIIMPLTVAQCEPVHIYYNVTAFVAAAVGAPELILYPPVWSTYPPPVFAWLTFPYDIGYLEWICNIPAGEIFVATGLFAYIPHNSTTYSVQRGSSSACFTTTYNSNLHYNTSIFASYTATSYPPSNGYTSAPTTPFPTGTFSTLTLNPAETSGTCQTTPPSPFPRRIIAGSIVGGIIILVTFTFFGFYLGRRLSPKPDENPPYGPPHEIPMDSTVSTMPVTSRNQAAHK